MYAVGLHRRVTALRRTPLPIHAALRMTTGLLTMAAPFLAGFGTTFAAVPDLVAMVRRRSTLGMNPRMAAIMGVFQILWVYYGLLIASRPVIVWNVIAVLINISVVFSYRHFRRIEGAPGAQACSRGSLLLLVDHVLVDDAVAGYPRSASHRLSIVRHDIVGHKLSRAIHLDDDVPGVIVDAIEDIGELGVSRRRRKDRHFSAVELAGGLGMIGALPVLAVE